MYPCMGNISVILYGAGSSLDKYIIYAYNELYKI